MGCEPATTARTVTPTEQQVHSFLEMISLMAMLSVISLHWGQFLALLKRATQSGETPRCVEAAAQKCASRQSARIVPAAESKKTYFHWNQMRLRRFALTASPFQRRGDVGLRRAAGD
jgi:hypothetical protein